jgi:hypothetical protein
MASSRRGRERSDVSDTATACHAAIEAGARSTETAGSAASAQPRRRGSPRLDTRYDEATLVALRSRAKQLGLNPSSWVRAVVRDALDKRRTEEVDAAVRAAVLDIEVHVQPAEDARHLAAQVRPLAINVNDLSRRAGRGEPVTMGQETAELIALLREVRGLLGDRMTS